MDKGAVSVTVDDVTRTLRRGQSLLYAPMAFHRFEAVEGECPNLIVLSFSSDAKWLYEVSRHRLNLGNEEQTLLSRIVTEARAAFLTPLDMTYFKLRRRKQPPFGCEQMIKLCLEELLIIFRRRTLAAPGEQTQLRKSVQENDSEEQLKQIIAYLQQNVGRQLTLDTICRDHLISRSKLQRLFRLYKQTSAMEYFIVCKIDSAKQMIRERRLNFTEIAEALGYSSIHYFSKQFKAVTGVTPTDYSYSILLRTERKSC